MAIDVTSLLDKSHRELDALFSSVPAGPIPDGEAKGTAIMAPGTAFNPIIAKVIRTLVWQGKVFDREHGVLRNLVLPFGVQAVIAKVYKGTSWLDQQDCIVLDYSKTSLIARWIRDEIREISPGVYLGKAYWNKARWLDFTLEFNQGRQSANPTAIQ